MSLLRAIVILWELHAERVVESGKSTVYEINENNLPVCLAIRTQIITTYQKIEKLKIVGCLLNIMLITSQLFNSTKIVSLPTKFIFSPIINISKQKAWQKPAHTNFK